jgi:hypothetical protein
VHNAVVATDGGEIIGFHAGQLVAFDTEGKLLRVVETGLTEGHGVTLVREGDAELYGRVAVLDPEDNLLGYIGDDPDPAAAQGWPTRPGWPNALAGDGRTEIPDLPRHDRFNSPHAVAADAAGNLYVSEWLLGGRYTKLTVQR